MSPFQWNISMRLKQRDEQKLSYFSLKTVLNTILKIANIGQIYHKHTIRELSEQSAGTRFLGKNLQISIKIYF